MREKGSLRRNGSSDGVLTRRSPEELRKAFRIHQEDGTADLFVYGTMLSDSHVKLILNRLPATEPAVLRNYMKIVPPGAFFFIIRQNGSEVRGRILKNLTPEEFERLDRFEDEGNLYFRNPVVVRERSGGRRRCMTYVGNIPALQKAFGREILFEDRYSQYLERKIDQALREVAPNEQGLARRALQELMGAAADQLIQSHFDGDYVCNYLMVQAFTEAKPPDLNKVFSNEAIRPYADNYMKFACKHIIFNQIVEKLRHDFHNAVRVSRKYFRHGVAVLLSFLYCNSFRETIGKMMREKELDRAIPGRSYLEYAERCIVVADEIYDRERMEEIIDFAEMNWYSTPTPLGAELEFSRMGARAVCAEPGEDPVYDSFNWFNDFDLQKRTWRLGGHVDSHSPVPGGRSRARGFFEYALGRFNIVGDLSRPLFDCPRAMSMVINEAVKFLEIPTHSLHLSMELRETDGKPAITDKAHEESDLVCLLLLGGDLRRDENGILREWRIYNNELDTNMEGSLNFSDRKHHYSRLGDEDSGADVMEYKFLRLKSTETDYAKVIEALKAYQLETCARPISVLSRGEQELPEHAFLRKWAASPQSLSIREITRFLEKIERGMLRERNAVKLDRRSLATLENIESTLMERNRSVIQG